MKKIICTMLCVALVAVLCVAFVACDEGNAKTYQSTADVNIVYLGDSIAEALIGPSPLGERDNYGYYALVGRCNNFNYYNHSVSGHKTSGGMAGQDGLLEMLQREDENATLLKTHVQEADIIHISVLGNNVLQYDLGLLMVEVADPQFEAKYAQGTTLINALHDGGEMQRPSLTKPGQMQEFKFPATYENICDVVARIKELNPNAKIIFQKVYNPVYEGTTLLYNEARDALANIIDDGRFGCEGQPIQTTAQLRKVAQLILNHLNGILDEYLEEYPDAFTILDINAEFDDVTNSDVKGGETDLSQDGLGRALIFNDWTHPSNFGHAVIACATQDLLEQWGMADANALDNYKAIRLEQINRMFADVAGFDADTARQNINSAQSFYTVTTAYFTAIDGFVPINY